MPCMVWESEAERRAHERSMWDDNADHITHEMDVLREQLLDNPENVGEEQQKSFKSLLNKFLMMNFDPVKSGVRDRIHSEAARIITAMDNHSVIEAILSGDQVEHRKEDLMRVIMYFAKRKDLDAIKRVIDVDLNKPLEPQLGFDPDDYS